MQIDNFEKRHLFRYKIGLCSVAPMYIKACSIKSLWSQLTIDINELSFFDL